MKHNANLDVTNDLRVRGRVTSSLEVQEDVTANAFYVNSGVGVNAGLELNEFGLIIPDGDATVPGMRAVGMGTNEGLMFSGTNWQFRRGGSAVFTIGGGGASANLLFNISNGAEDAPSLRFTSERMGMYKEAPGVIGFSVGDVKRVTIGRDGLRVVDTIKANAFYVTSSTGVNTGLELNEFGVVAPDGDNVATGFRHVSMGLDEGMFFDGQWRFRLGGTAVFSIGPTTINANKIFNLTDGSAGGPSLRFTSERMGMYKAAPSTFGFSVGDVERMTLGLDGMHVANKVEAEAFYVEGSGLEFSQEALTIPAVSSTKTGATYTGPDGLVYSVDPTRGGKRLSISRTTLNWAKAASAGVNVDGTRIQRANNNTAHGALMPRPGTITWVGGMSADVELGEMNMAVRKYVDGVESSAGGGTLIANLPFYLRADTQYVTARVDVDIETHEMIDAYLEEVTGGAGISNPILDVEIAWRDDT